MFVFVYVVFLTSRTFVSLNTSSLNRSLANTHTLSGNWQPDRQAGSQFDINVCLIYSLAECFVIYTIYVNTYVSSRTEIVVNNSRIHTSARTFKHFVFALIIFVSLTAFHFIIFYLLLLDCLFHLLLRG